MSGRLNALSVERYIAAQPPPVAHILEQLREVILAAAPSATETIKYGMPTFLLSKSPAIYVAAWKKHIGLYPVHPQKPALEARIAPYRAAKDTLQLKYAEPIPYDLVARIVKARVAELAAKRA